MVGGGERGEPGKPGKRGEGAAGGAGGEGGKGGAGQPEGAGGPGGIGGSGGQGARGERGERGERGPTNRLAVIGYVILTLGVLAAFVAVWHNDRKVEDARVERVGQLNLVNEAQCASLRNLYAIIRKTLEDGDIALDKIEYYRTHPREREDAHNRNRETIQRFRTPPCPRKISLPK